MSLVELLPDDSIDPQDRAMAESGRAQYGELLATWRAILHRPGLFTAYLPFLRAVAGPGVLDAGLKDLSALLVGHLNHCRYTVSHRYASARRNAVPDDLIEQVVNRRWNDLPDDLRVALELTVSLTTDPPAIDFATRPQAVPAELVERVRSVFDDEQTVELVMSISVWNALARFHRVMGFDLDMPEPPAGVVPA